MTHINGNAFGGCRLQTLSCVLLAGVLMAPLSLSGQTASVVVPANSEALLSSSSPAWDAREPAAEADAAVPVASPHAALAGGTDLLPRVRPFSAVGVEVKAGLEGFGFDVAVPLTRRINLRGGAQFLGVTGSFSTDGLQVAGSISAENVDASVDIYPFHNSFHISPGITAHNDNHVTGNLYVPPGGSFSLGDTDYTSDPTDPITGLARLTFGGTVAPRLTVGWGNLVPHNGSRISFPFDIGVEFTSRPVLQLYLNGNGCDSDGCGDINSGDGLANQQQQVQQIENELAPLRFYPIMSFGVSYKFGR